jgi:arsenate reductase-like glutaredoxin family protein
MIGKVKKNLLRRQRGSELKKQIDFYGWSQCNNCLQTKAYLLERGYGLEYRDFFKERFSKTEIIDILGGRKAAEMFSPNGPILKALGVNVENLTQDEMIELMLEEPRLVKRPIVRINGQIIFGANVKMLRELLF